MDQMEMREVSRTLSRHVDRRVVLKGFGAVGAASLMSVILAACSSGSGAGGSRKLTFVFQGDVNSQAAVKAEYAGFVKANPGIAFSAQGIASTGWAQFANAVATRIAGGLTPDVIDIATEGLGIFRSKGLVGPLDEYIKKDQAAIDEYYADLSPTLKKWSDKYGNTGGTTYYMPGGFNTVALYCNTEIFQKAGVELPGTDDWTWDDFAAAGEKIKSATGAYLLPLSNVQFTDILPWLMSNGANTLNEDWTKPIVDSDAAIEAAEYCRMMVKKGYSPIPGGTFDAPTAMSQGKLACMAGGRWPTIDMIRLKLVDKVQIVKMPMKTVSAGPIGWDAFPILKASDNKDDAWKFVKYTTSKAAGTAFAKVGGSNIPARRSVALSDAFLNGAPKGSELLYKLADTAIPVPSPNRGAESEAAVEAAWLSILTGNAQAEPALKKLNSQLAGLL